MQPKTALALFSFSACASFGACASGAVTSTEPSATRSPAFPSSTTAPVSAETTGQAASPGTLSPGLTEGMARVRGLIADPTDTAINAAFSPKFLSKIPPVSVKELLERVGSRIGTCAEQEVVSIESQSNAIVQLNCARGAATVTIAVNPEPPHLITLLLLRPAKN